MGLKVKPCVMSRSGTFAAGSLSTCSAKNAAGLRPACFFACALP